MKMKSCLYTLLVLLWFGSARSQQIYQLMQFPEKIDKRYVITPLLDEEKYRKKVLKKIPRKQLKPFTFGMAFTKSELFQNGKIYLNWNALENYVNEVLDSILPANLKSKKIRAYIGRSSEINAYCLYDGTMIVNVGLIGEVKNEAALAAVMGHELGHFIKNHLLNGYVQRLKEKNKKKEDKLELAIKSKSYSQKLELEADEMGYSLVHGVGYDAAQANYNFELFIREKEYASKRYGSELVSDDSLKVKTKSGTYTANTFEKLLSTHPDEKERKDKLTAFLKSNPGGKKINTKIDEDLFAYLQKQARLESIGLIFSSHDYAECLERAFRFYLFDPTEITYSYFIAESIRRICLMDFTLRKKGFLSENLTNNGFKEGQGILHDLKFVIPNEEQYKKIKATDLSNPAKIPFETYKEAFYYYNDKLIKVEYAEAYLIAALFENNQNLRQRAIQKYLAHPKAQRKQYATHYLDNTLTTSITDNPEEIVMVPQVDFYSHTRYTKYGSFGRIRYNYGKSEIVGSQMATGLSQAINSSLPNVKSISLPQASRENFNTKERYEEIIGASLLAQREENEGYEVKHYYKELEDEDYIGRVDIFRLNPEIWDFFDQNKINSITYARYTRHFSEMDGLLRRPGLYLGIPTLGFTWLFLPFRIANSKQLEIVSYNAQAGELLYFSRIKAYWLTSKKGVKMFKKIRKDKADYIKENYSGL